MRLSDESSSFEPVNKASFFNSTSAALKALRKRSDKVMSFGSCKVRSGDYAQFISEAIKSEDKSLLSRFSFFEVFGKDEWGEILLTSYYSPVIQGRRKPDSTYNYPLFSTPTDLVEVEMKKFSKQDLIGAKVVRSKVAARIKSGWNGVRRIVPYYSRAEIDKNFDLLKRTSKVLAYVKPIDAFFFHIQGSGSIRFSDGQLLSLGYAAQNGHRYFSIGKLLYDRIEKEDMTKAKIERFLEQLTDKDLFEFLGHNPSYVFFKKMKQGLGRTTLGPEVQDKTTIAIDPSMISLGSLAILSYERPSFESLKDDAPSSFSQESLLVWAHDTGGAIKGAGRADLYWGSGKAAGQSAGVINQRAKLWILAPKACQNSN